MFFTLSQIKFNHSNLDHFVRHFHKYLGDAISSDEDMNVDTKNDLHKALNNVRATLRLLPHVLGNLDVSKILSNPELLLDAGDIEFEHLNGDLSMLWKMVTHSLAKMRERDKSEAIRVGIALYDALRSPEDMDQVCERVAKLLIRNVKSFFSDIGPGVGAGEPVGKMTVSSLVEDLKK